MFAVSADGVDFWSETPKCGWQLDRGMKTTPNGLVQSLDWAATQGAAAILSEERRIEIAPPSGGADSGCTLLTWQSKLSAGPGRESVKLTGARYFGLGMRYLQAMDKGGAFFNAEKQPGVQRDPKRPEWNIDGPAWCAYTALCDGKPVTVAMFNDPKNLRPPSWFTMQNPFAYLAGTISLDLQLHIIEKDKSLTLRYGVALWDGKIEDEKIAAAYKFWAGGL